MSTARRTGTLPGAASKVESAREVVPTAIDELSAQLESGKSEQLLAYLSTMARFHRYSFGNVLLIMSQRPDATRVAGFHTWKSMGRSVRKGERGIVIIAPMLLRKGEPATGSEGDSTAEPVLRFRAVHVFDISQTEGEELPEPDCVSGDPGDALARLEAAIRAEGITLETVDTLGGAHGVSTGGTIRIIGSLSSAERFAVLVHEWAHELLHKVDREHRPPKTVRETEAEAVAFVVSHAFGLETGSASSDYIQLYDGDKDTLTASLDRIQKTACRIIDAINDQDGPDQTPSPITPTPSRDDDAAAVASEEHELDPDRFTPGTFCYRRERTVGEGDVSASYSADKIALEGRVRNPFRWNGQLWVSIGCRQGTRHEVYRLVDPAAFSRQATTYAEKTCDAASTRRDPDGFYDGMRVNHGKQTYVLCGPEVIVKPGATRQGELFPNQPLQSNTARLHHEKQSSR